MGFNLYGSQESILDYLKSTFPNYQFFRGGVPDDEVLLRDENGKVINYCTLRFGSLRPRPRGKSFAGPRGDDYYTTMDVNVIAPTDDEAAQSLNIFVDRLIGFKPLDGTSVIPEGVSIGDITVKNSAAKPTAYAASQRFTYGLNTTTPTGFLQP
jgi:hypothetical protein